MSKKVMNRKLTARQLRHLRLHLQLLGGGGQARTAAAVIAALCGVQAQDRAAAELALRARTSLPTRAAVTRERVTARSFVRTWCMRGTLHHLPAADVRWLLALHGPLFIATSRRRFAQLGLDERACVKSVQIVRDAAAREPLTRAAAAGALQRAGIDAPGQTAYHVLRRAALDGAICFGEETDGGEATYVLLYNWIPPERDLAPGDALAELARRYLAAYAPASVEDFAAWSGLPLSVSRCAWKLVEEREDVLVPGGTAAILREHLPLLEADSPPRNAVLVPAFDPYLLGYRSRLFAVAADQARRIHPGGGLLRPALLLDGICSATWRLARRRGRLRVVVEPFMRLSNRSERDLGDECGDVGRFLGEPVELELLSPEAAR